MIRKSILRVESLESRIGPAVTPTSATTSVTQGAVIIHNLQGNLKNSGTTIRLASNLVPVASPSVPTPGTTVAVATAMVAKSMIAGTVQGGYVSTLVMLDTPSGFHLNGTAKLGKLGSVDFYAHLYSVGFRTKGNARGEITLSNSRGSVTLSLTGPEQKRLAPLPDTFSYRVIKGTGEFKDLRESGSLRLQRTLNRNPVVNGIRYVEAGSFRLTI